MRLRDFDDDEAVIMVAVDVLVRVEAAVRVVCEQRQANVWELDKAVVDWAIGLWRLNPTPPTPASLNAFLTSSATISTRLPRLMGGFDVDMIEYVAENTTGSDVGWEERAVRRRDWDW